MSTRQNTIFFDEPRFKFGAPGLFIARLFSISFLGGLVVAVPFLLVSTGRSFFIGLFLSLFLMDYFVHLKTPERFIGEFKGNVAQCFSPILSRILYEARLRSKRKGEDFFLTCLVALLEERDSREVLSRLGVPADVFLEKAREILMFQDDELRGALLEEAVQLVALAAYESALRRKAVSVQPRDLLFAFSTLTDPRLKKLFDFFEISSQSLEYAILLTHSRSFLPGVRVLPQALGGTSSASRFLKHQFMNRSWTARPTSTLDHFATDLTDLARAQPTDFVVGHDREFQQFMNILSRPGRQNALLVGESGVGKSSLVHYFAHLVLEDKAPPIFFDRRIVSLSIGDLISSAPPEEVATRLRDIAQEILFAGNVVLFIPDVHMLWKTSEKGVVNAADIFLPILRNDSIPVIAETTPRDFKQYIEPHTDFLDLFEMVRVEEMDDESAARFLAYAGIIFERQFGVLITVPAIVASVSLARRYFRQKFLPSSAVEFLKESLVRALGQGLKILNVDLVFKVAEEKSGVPVQKPGKDEADTLLRLEEIIHEKFINQDAAVSAVARALREYRSGLARRGGPIATFLFVGPTGVGKTELSKLLALIQFGSKEAFVRFDMSEYQEKQSISRFIGSPQGEKSGALTDAILARPFSLILLDEFEKAHPDILNLFLQVFDDGRLTDGLNRTVSFQDTIIIATSNAHSEFIKTEIEKGRSVPEIAEELKKKLTNVFKPELLNRFSSVIVFRTLELKEITSITRLILNDLVATLKEAQGMSLVFDDSAVNKISELGYSPAFGARPLRQVVSERVKGVLAEKILKGDFVRGDSIGVSFLNEEFVFTKE